MRVVWNRSAAVRLLALLLLHAAVCWGQGLTGELTGVVSDPAGRPLSGAVATLENAQTGLLRTTLTINTGRFRFDQILPGTFHVSIAAVDFKKFERRNVDMSAGERLSLGAITLELG
ncbi:MAG: carboxypeptidase regulatory-like domain-containing protein, partial [Acidobacteria bacterium]|nr:carboxypeptidase regulatory-like domain-containing protein [Acidobacteriota bacterium]